MKNTTKNNVSAREVSNQIGKMLNPQNEPYMRITDDQGLVIEFLTKRDYLQYLDEKDVELKRSYS